MSRWNKRTLLYCPTLYRYDEGMRPPFISPVFYFQWQKNLWEIFQELKGWRVIWNAQHPGINFYDPISKWKAKNIKYTGMKIYNALSNCDRVLVDVPSTVMWAAKEAEKPCLCIAAGRDKNWIREDIETCPSIEIWFESDLVKAKNILELWLSDLLPTVKNITNGDMFVANDNDWLKEIVI